MVTGTGHWGHHADVDVVPRLGCGDDHYGTAVRVVTRSEIRSVSVGRRLSGADGPDEV